MLVETMFTAANEIVRERQIPLNYDVQLFVGSKEYHKAYTSTFLPLEEWFARIDRVQDLLENMLNSNQQLNPLVGFDVSLINVEGVIQHYHNL